MKKIDTGGPANPTDSERQIGPHSYHFEGKTWLDECAMLMAVELYRACSDPAAVGVSREEISNEAYLRAQAMLAEKRRLEGGE